MKSWQLCRTMCGIAAAIISGAAVRPAPGALLASWTFEESRPTSAGPHAPEEGQGTLFVIHQGESEYSSPVGNGSEHSFSSTGWRVGDYIQINYPESPRNEVVRVRFDMASSAAEPPVFALQSRRGDLPFGTGEPNIKPSDAPPNVAWNSATRQLSYSFDFQNPNLRGAPFSFRLFCYDVPFPLPPDVNVRLDNVTLEAIPEPASGLLAACAAFGVAAFRRRWRCCSPS